MRKTTKILVVALSVLVGVPVALFVLSFAMGAYLYVTADFLQPRVGVEVGKYELSVDNDSLRICDNSTLLLNKYGLWEAHISGDPSERGVKYGTPWKPEKFTENKFSALGY